MKNQNINNKLIRKLQKIIEAQQLSLLVKKFKNELALQQEVNNNSKLEHENENSSQNQSLIINHTKRFTSESKKRLLLRRKQSQKQLPKQQNQVQDKQRTQQKTLNPQQKITGKPIKDRAVFINLQQIPYLHSTDLLNHLYKKPTTLTQQNSEPFTLYNPPSSNPYVLTKVKYLSIYYCKIQSLRDMGTGWSNLVQLSIYFSKLKDLSGLNAFPSLAYLHCPFNSISTISDLMFHPTLVSVDFESNLISDMSEVEHLFTVDNLQYLNLLNNPVFHNKQNKRKIQQKFDKIIQTENNRIQDYLNQKKREIWEIQNIQAIQYCNNILTEFFRQSKNDEINVQVKHKMISQNVQHLDLDFEAFQANLMNNIHSEKQNQQQQQNNSQKQLNIEYILPEIPQNEYFQEMIMKGNLSQIENSATFCQQKIYMTPLTQMIKHNEVYIGPVLDKYLKNKLFHREDINDRHSRVIKKENNKKQQNQTKNQQQEKSKPKRISKLSMTGFSSKGFSSIRSSQLSPNENCMEETQKSKQFATTASSFSTNCTNMNNTTTSFSLRRSRIGLSKSKQKPLGKISMCKNIGEGFHFQQSPGFDINNLHSSSLAKQSRMKLGRSLKKQIKDMNYESTNQQKSPKNIPSKQYDEQSNEKQKPVFSSSLKRKSLLSHSKKQKQPSTLTKKEIES